MELRMCSNSRFTVSSDVDLAWEEVLNHNLIIIAKKYIYKCPRCSTKSGRWRVRRKLKTFATYKTQK